MRDGDGMKHPFKGRLQSAIRSGVSPSRCHSYHRILGHKHDDSGLLVRRRFCQTVSWESESKSAQTRVTARWQKFGAWRGVMQQRRFHPALSERFESRVQGGECHSATSLMPPLNDGKEEPLFMETSGPGGRQESLWVCQTSLVSADGHGSS